MVRKSASKKEQADIVPIPFSYNEFMRAMKGDIVVKAVKEKSKNRTIVVAASNRIVAPEELKKLKGIKFSFDMSNFTWDQMNSRDKVKIVHFDGTAIKIAPISEESFAALKGV